MVSGSLRRVLGNVTLNDILSEQRAAIMHQIRDEVARRGQEFRHRGRRCAAAPRRSARGEQPGDLRPHAVRAAAAGGAISRRRRRGGADRARQRRARTHRDPGRGAARGAEVARRGRRRRRSRSTPRPLARTRSSSPSTARCRPIAMRSAGDDTSFVLSPDRELLPLFPGMAGSVGTPAPAGTTAAPGNGPAARQLARPAAHVSPHRQISDAARALSSG